MKFTIIPDSFKGGISPQEFFETASAVIKENMPLAEIEYYQISDGGEGCLESLKSILGGKILQGKVTDSNFFKKYAAYLVGDDFAAISVSSCAGITDCLIKNPLYTTSYGVGELIKTVKIFNKKNIYLCLGGSCTVDGGAGMLAALGVMFYDAEHNSFIPTGGTLDKIVATDWSKLQKNIDGLKITALSDVNNPLLGENGCSRVFAPQKGATAVEVEILEKNMQKWAEITAFAGVNPQMEKNGAAGGLGYAAAILKAKMVSGIDFILDKIDFEKKTANSDYIFTGEGKFDRTSLMGKAVCRIVDRNAKAKVVVFCGENSIDKSFNDTDKLKKIYRIKQINNPQLSLKNNIDNTKMNLANGITSFLKEEYLV